MQSRPLNICMITTFYPPYHFGGDAMAVSRLVHALARRGHRVDVIHNRDAWKMLAGDSKPNPIGESPSGVTTIPLHSRFGSLACLFTQQTGRPASVAASATDAGATTGQPKGN